MLVATQLPENDESVWRQTLLIGFHALTHLVAEIRQRNVHVAVGDCDVMRALFDALGCPLRRFAWIVGIHTLKPTTKTHITRAGLR